MPSLPSPRAVRTTACTFRHSSSSPRTDAAKLWREAVVPSARTSRSCSSRNPASPPAAPSTVLVHLSRKSSAACLQDEQSLRRRVSHPERESASLTVSAWQRCRPGGLSRRRRRASRGAGARGRGRLPTGTAPRRASARGRLSDGRDETRVSRGGPVAPCCAEDKASVSPADVESNDNAKWVDRVSMRVIDVRSAHVCQRQPAGREGVRLRGGRRASASRRPQDRRSAGRRPDE